MSWGLIPVVLQRVEENKKVEEDWAENLPTTWPAGSSMELLVSPGALTCFLLGPSPFIVFRFSRVSRTVTLWP